MVDGLQAPGIFILVRRVLGNNSTGSRLFLISFERNDGTFQPIDILNHPQWLAHRGEFDA